MASNGSGELMTARIVVIGELLKDKLGNFVAS